MTKLEELKKEIQRLRPETLIERDDGFGSICFLEKPITLEDVLAVLLKVGEYESGECSHRWKENGFPIFCGHEFPCPEHHFNIFELLKLWILGESIDDQSEETINFLYNLILKK